MVDPQALQRGEPKARCAFAKELGGRTDDAALAALTDALDVRDEVVRDCVREAVRENPAIVPFLLAETERRDAALVAASSGSDKQATQAATFALGQHLRRAGALVDARLLSLVDLGLLPRQPRFVRSGAAWCLSGQSLDPATGERFARALADADKDVRWPAADGLLRAARGANTAQKAAIAALVRPRLAVEADAGVRAKLEQTATVLGLTLTP
jgi:hypothetical protein